MASPSIVYPKTLTETLKFLQVEGLVQHHQEGRSADYRLTPAGTGFIKALAQLDQWAEEYHIEPGTGPQQGR